MSRVKLELSDTVRISKRFVAKIQEYKANFN